MLAIYFQLDIIINVGTNNNPQGSQERVEDMTEAEKKICDYVLRYGTIIKNMEYRNIKARQYIIELDGQTYTMSKQNGEWIYFFHHNN